MEVIYVFCFLSFCHLAWSGGGWKCEGMNCVEVVPTPNWDAKCKDKFVGLDVYGSFAQPTAHVLHRVTREDVKFFFGVDLPADNGIPTQNQDLSVDESDSVLENMPSRPTGMASSGYHAFASVMDKIDDPDWDMRGNALERLIHMYHMQELFVKVNAKMGQWKNVADDVCTCALDTEGNGINQELRQKFFYLRDEFNSPNYTATYSIPVLQDHSSWLFWKEWKKFHLISDMPEAEALRSSALYFHCALKKYKNTKCCDKKIVGNESYTKIATGEVPVSCKSNCIYERDNLPGSRFCFAMGKSPVQCNA